jgi:CelD/BcsL family acetyltransferase involved in cellulose biosynthesis
MPTMALERYDVAGFEGIAPEWEELAQRSGTPFLTAAWLASWWRAAGPERELALVLRGDGGQVLAGACFVERGRSLAPAADDHTNDWGVVARDGNAQRRFWAELARAGYGMVGLKPISAGDPAVAMAREALRAAGYRLVEEGLNPSPWLELPGSFDDLLAARSRNLRSQVGAVAPFGKRGTLP